MDLDFAKFRNLPFFVFNAESIGLHGDPFAVAGGVYTRGIEQERFCYSCPDKMAEGNLEDRAWVRENCPPIPITHPSPRTLCTAFWRKWDEYKSQFPGLVAVAECQWPVEARLFHRAVELDQHARNWEGPYPLHELASFMVAAGMDPMHNYEREGKEHPAHDPLSDVRLSARLLETAMQRLEKLYARS